MLLLILLFLSLLKLSSAENYKFSVALKEQNSEYDSTNQKYLSINCQLTCGNKDCDYTVDVENDADTFFKVLVNNRECPNQYCQNSFNRHQVVNVTVLKIDTNDYLKIMDFEYEVIPKIVILGCESGFYNDGICTRMTETVQNFNTEPSFFDEVCVCSSNQSPYCTDLTTKGVCVVGEEKWWTGLSSSSTSSTPTTTTPSVVHFTLIIDDITISLQESKTKPGPDDFNTVTTAAYLNCTESECHYRTTVTNNAPDYFKVFVDNNLCTDPICLGSFKKGQSAAVIVKRAGEKLNLFTYQWLLSYGPEVIVLGCRTGLILTDTCLRSMDSPRINQEDLHDEVCSCQGTKTACDPQSEIGVCLGGDIFWWEDDDDSRSTSISTSTLAPRDPNSFELNLLLSEGDIDHPEKNKNVSIYAFMNCSALACQYTVTVVDYAQVYYTVLVNGSECSGSTCRNSFPKGHHIPVVVTRLSEKLNLIDLQFIDSPNVIVLGCHYGMLEYGFCRQTSGNYDVQVQKDDSLCVCQSTSLKCDSDTLTGQCSDGTPVWWEPIGITSTEATTVTTTFSPFGISFDIALFETVAAGTQRISIHGNMTCSNDACFFLMKVTNDNPEYFSVFLSNGRNCQQSCDSTFQSSETVPVYVYKPGQFVELFEMRFNEVIVLNCTSGWLVAEKCVMVLHDNDEVCSCQGINNVCQGIETPTKCDSGDPTWWKPDPKFTTIPSTSVGTTKSVLSTTSSSVKLTEELTNQINQTKILKVEPSMSCYEKMCTWNLTIENGDSLYYNVLMDGTKCLNKCSGEIRQGDSDKTLVVHRLGQHLNFVEFQYKGIPKMMVMGCEAMQEDKLLINQIDEEVCLHIFQTSYNAPNYYNDDVCICKGNGNDCDNHTKVGKCSSGSFAWWDNDKTDSTIATTPSTSTTTSTTTKTSTITSTSTSTKITTVPNSHNHFSFEIALSEGRDNEKKQLAIASNMSCSVGKCEYSVEVDNSDLTYFRVFVGSQQCQNKKCTGSFARGGSVNTTVFRENQVLDLFDFEYVKTPRLVVIGCEDGYSDYGTCAKITEVVEIKNKDYVDQICSCQSTQLNCNQGDVGVCRLGQPKWWRNVDSSSTSAGSSTPTTAPITTTSSTVPSLKDLSNEGVGLNNVTQVLNDTHHYSSQGPRLNRTQIFEITKILHNSANLAGISTGNAVQILQNMDQCLDAHEREIRNGQSKEYSLLAILTPMVQNTKDKIIQYLHGTNLGFNAKKVNCLTENHTDDGLIYYGPGKGYEILNETNRLTTTGNSIVVPLGSICEDQEVSHVFFTIFRGQKLFSGPQKYRRYGGEPSEDESDMDSEQRWKRDAIRNDTDTIGQAPVPSKCTRQISVPSCPVMSATLMAGDKVISTLRRTSIEIMNDGAQVSRRAPTIAKLQFDVGKIPRPLHGNTIVSWFQTSQQMWALNDQCKIETDANGLITASCEHLTDFTVLIYGQLNAEYVCSLPLTIISYSVNGASILCLLLLILIGLMFYIRYDFIKRALSYIRGQAQTSGDIINLAYYCIFFMFFILSLFFMDQSSGNEDSTGTSTYCVAIAAMSYFSLISAIMMSMLIGIRMVCHFFSAKLRAFFGVMTSPPAALSIGLIIPFTFTMVLTIFDTSFFERNDSFCWVRPDYIVYAVVIPVVLPIINGLICSTFAIYKMFFQAKRVLASKETSHYDAEFWSKVIGLLIMQVAMGLPWGIEFILIGVAGPSPWNYIFVILLGTQGIDLFLIFLYRRQRLVNESRKWSARESKKLRSRHILEKN